MKLTLQFVLLHIVALVASTAAVQAADGPAHGVRSVTPPKRWEDAFVTGNGRMGAMLFGSPGKEVFVANHCRLFLPLGNREIVPDLAQHVPELRRIIREQTYGDAMRFFLGKAKEQGYPGLTWTDKFHPGVLINLRQEPEGPVTGYRAVCHDILHFSARVLVSLAGQFRQSGHGRLTRSQPES